MNNFKLKKQFEKMGIAIILNAVLVAIFYYLFTKFLQEGDFKESKQVYNIAVVVELGFAIWYITWWFITAKYFVSGDGISTSSNIHVENTTHQAAVTNSDSDVFRIYPYLKNAGKLLLSFIGGVVALFIWLNFLYLDVFYYGIELIDSNKLRATISIFVINDLGWFFTISISIILGFLLNKERKSRLIFSIILGALFGILSVYRDFVTTEMFAISWILIRIAVIIMSTFLPYWITYRSIKLGANGE
jgi:hypothetical protein